MRPYNLPVPYYNCLVPAVKEMILCLDYMTYRSLLRAREPKQGKDWHYIGSLFARFDAPRLNKDNIVPVSALCEVGKPSTSNRLFFFLTSSLTFLVPELNVKWDILQGQKRPAPTGGAKRPAPTTRGPAAKPHIGLYLRCTIIAMLYARRNIATGKVRLQIAIIMPQPSQLRSFSL